MEPGLSKAESPGFLAGVAAAGTIVSWPFSTSISMRTKREKVSLSELHPMSVSLRSVFLRKFI